MALGKRKRKLTSFWVETSQLQARGRHPFYSRLNEILDRAKFDAYAERICRKYYATTMGRPSIPPGVYFRCFLIGYFEGIDSERGIAYRVSDSLGPREFLVLSLEEQTPDHSTLSKTRRLMNLGTHKAVFRWVLQRLAAEALLSGKTLGVDGTTLEANAALKSIVRRDNGASYDEHVAELMKDRRDRRDRSADAGRAPALRSQAQEVAVEPGLGESARPGSAHHEDERRPHAPGLQGRARGGSGDGRGGRADGAARRSRGHRQAPLDLANAIRGFALLAADAGETERATSLWQEARRLYDAASVQRGVQESDAQIERLAGK
jgi:transposase